MQIPIARRAIDTMPKTTDEVLNGLLSTSYKLDDGTVAGLKEPDGSWKDDALDFFLSKDAERVTALRGDIDKQLTERGAKAKREVMEEFERQIRDEFGLKDATAKGVDLVKHAVAAKVKALETIPDERVKTHPTYITLEQQLANMPKEFEVKLKQREDELKSEFRAKALTQQAIQQARTLFRGMNPVLPKNEAVAAAQLTLLDNFIAQHKLQFVEDERTGELKDIIPMAADGSGALKDAHGHPVSYADLVKNGASKFFEFAQGEQRGGAPNPAGTGAGSGDGGGAGASYNPKSEAEYAKLHAEIMRKFTDLTERRSELDKLKEAAVKAGIIGQ